MKIILLGGEKVKKGKSINGLMRHIRTNHDVGIEGSKDKNTLVNMGYYHGYKRFRYIKQTSNKQMYSDFSQIKAIKDFDFEIKRIFYPMITLVETDMKNRTIEALVTNQDPDIESIYQTKLTAHLDYAKDSHDKAESNNFKKTLKDRLEFRSIMDATIGHNYGKNDALSHFVHHSKSIPLWVFFEIITFGQLGHFTKLLSMNWRLKVSEANGLGSTSFNQNGRMIHHIIFTLTDLRNATMHNSAVFDANFNKDGVAKALKKYLIHETKIQAITFDTIIDYLILLVFILKKHGYSKTELKAYVRQFSHAKEKLNQSIPKSSYGLLLGMDSNKKIEELYKFIATN